ncbi:basic proline-rich protein-like [Heterocephalus glaber]|uniref:Basic proline-rich protein-like n=1 Tax=Heterocephalus glaber TaxID=10181 RepID=A0AAX6THR7_HETGA|nr:basic proline-rich protein-like [Heterocephalus glaber]XP_021120561.1 basic proline-rich protein-like [Heterocephalus glaber]
MPLGTPLPPPPRPRLGWPAPRRCARGIMPSTAAGRGRGAALGGAARGCGVRPPEGLAESMNRAGCTHSPRASPLLRPESPFGPATAAFLGMARPGPARGGESGTGTLGVVLPSFLSLKPKSFPREDARAARSGPPRALRRTWASDAATLAGGTVLRRRPLRAHVQPPGRGGERRGGCCGRRVWSAEPSAGSGLTERGPAPRHALPTRARPSRRPAELPRGPAPRASAPRARPRRPRSAGPRSDEDVGPGPGSCHVRRPPPTSERARELEGRAGRGRGARPPPPAVPERGQAPPLLRSARRTPEPIEIFCVASPPFV